MRSVSGLALTTEIRPRSNEKRCIQKLGGCHLTPAVKGGDKVGHVGGAKVYHQRSLASVNVRVNCSGEVSQRQAGSRLGG